ncbi:MAG: hypothetical protein GEV10_24860 [Streptosporangiales bacterium]|nr:hypothetical protein [Streptosporangiales bacterium]
MHHSLERRLELVAPVERVWATVTDVERLVSWISVLHSARELERLSSYTATLEDRLGPFRLRADLDVRVTDVVEPRTITIRADGEDRQVGSRIAVAGTLKLSEMEHMTLLAIIGEYEITGKAASLGSSSIRKKANMIVAEFCARAAAELDGASPGTATRTDGRT